MREASNNLDTKLTDEQKPSQEKKKVFFRRVREIAESDY